MSMFPEEYLAKEWDQTQLMDGTPIVAVLDRRKSEGLSSDTTYPYRVVCTTGTSFVIAKNGIALDGTSVLKPAPKVTRPLTREEWPDGPVMVRRGENNSYCVWHAFIGGIDVAGIDARSWKQLHDEGWEYHTGQGSWRPCKANT